jgi:hypothetical protein
MVPFLPCDTQPHHTLKFFALKTGALMGLVGKEKGLEVNKFNDLNYRFSFPNQSVKKIKKANTFYVGDTFYVGGQ